MVWKTSEPGENATQERVILVGLKSPRQSLGETEEHLDELLNLTVTAGGVVVSKFIQERTRRDPAFAIGRGKVTEVAEARKRLKAGLVIFDDDLAPAQVRNLERALECTVLDRAGLILDIFARRARSREAKVQVELAQLRYLLPRLARRWTHLERQVGGIGVRGVGETQIELDRRLIQKRIARLGRELAQVESERKERRKGRSETYRVALVGYTNAGKSTLLNHLTGASALVENQLFATLDPLIRKGKKGYERFLFIDTVGFIRKLPPQLVASFRSTLEEAREADLLLHVIDLSHPVFEDQMRTTWKVLEELKLDDRPVLSVFNKVDRLTDPQPSRRAKSLDPDAIFVSAIDGSGFERLGKVLKKTVAEEMVVGRASLPLEAGAAIARLHALARVIQSRTVDGMIEFQYRARRVNVGLLNKVIRKAGGA